MQLNFDKSIAKNYSSGSQVARVLTEHWVKINSYCPSCGELHLNEFENNKPVADFYCTTCSEQFELKSKNDTEVGNKILAGAYSTMIDRINSDKNPNFFFLTYDKEKWEVNNFLIIPKHYFVSDMIEKRKPLSKTAQRAGWVGCYIDLTVIPDSGKIFLIKNSEIISKSEVRSKWKQTKFLQSKKGESKGWILDVMNCIDAINHDTFSLKEIYSFENRLKQKYPNNNFIKDKIRQQLQLLRDKGVVEFVGQGKYKKVNHANI